MLSDVFGELEIEEESDEEQKKKYCKPEDYVAVQHYEGWFFEVEGEDNEEKREIMFNRAAYFYNKCQYEEALKAFESLLLVCKHNRSHLVTVLDSIVRCCLKVPNSDREKMLGYVEQLQSMSTDYGDQLQFFNLASQVFAGNDQEKFIHYVCMLCASIDLPEHWTMFELGKDLKLGPNFRVAYVMRAILLCERHEKMARGFAKTSILRKLKELEGMLESFNLSAEELAKARLEMGTGLMTLDERSELTEDPFVPAHKCRSTVGTYKSPEEQRSIVNDFTLKFAWMFQNM